MFWYSLLAVLAVLFLLSVALPVPRRIWAFSLITHEVLLAVAVGRPVPAPAVVRDHRPRAPSTQKLTRPMLLRMFCEDLGPTFIKFGQIIASSAGMFPDAYVKEFQKVLDRVKPFPFEDVKRTLDEELGAEKAAHLVDIEPKQLASASIAQVHTAKLRDGTLGRHQGPAPGHHRALHGRHEDHAHASRRSSQRFKKNAELANPVGIVDDFTKTLTEELDFRKEAANLDKLQRHHARARPQAHPRPGAAPRVHDPQGARDGALQRPARRQVRGDQGQAASTARPSSSTACARGSSASCSTASSTATSTPAT